MALTRTELWHRALGLIPGGVNSPVRAMRSVGLDEPFFAVSGVGLTEPLKSGGADTGGAGAGSQP